MTTKHIDVYQVSTAQGTGTAFALAGQRVLATNFHVVAGGRTVALTLADKRKVRADVVLADPAWDLALLLPQEALPGQGLVLSDKAPTIGEVVNVLGFPLGMPFAMTKGVVSAVDQLVGNQSYIQTDAAVNPGNSGGPMVCEEGRVLGVTTCKLTEADNMGFASPTERLREVLALYREEGDERYAVKCPSCSLVLREKVEFCDGCGAELNVSIYFPEESLSPLAEIVEAAFATLGLDPLLTRAGRHHWSFHLGSAQLTCHLFSSEHLIISSLLAKLPKRPAEVLRFMLTYEGEHLFRLDNDGGIRLSHEAHLSDVFDPSRKGDIHSRIADLAREADRLDNVLIEEYGCEASSDTLMTAL